MILIIDNYDSFVENIARYVREAGTSVKMIRNDDPFIDHIKDKKISGIIISPGPKAPKEAGSSLEVIRVARDTIPILGVCLGHQCLVESEGGRTMLAQKPVHGHRSLLAHDGVGIFNNIPSPLSVGRYHSLIAHLPQGSGYIGSAHTVDEAGELMAVRHRVLPRYGVQFHPESILTEYGRAMIDNFVKICEPKIHAH